MAVPNAIKHWWWSVLWLLLLTVAVIVLFVRVGGVSERVTVVDNKGRALRTWATTIPPWAKHTQLDHLHAPPNTPPADHVQPPPDPPPFW